MRSQPPWASTISRHSGRPTPRPPASSSRTAAAPAASPPRSCPGRGPGPARARPHPAAGRHCTAIAARRRGLGGVLEQVDQDLLELGRIEVPRRRRRLALHLEAMTACRTARRATPASRRAACGAWAGGRSGRSPPGTASGGRPARGWRRRSIRGGAAASGLPAIRGPEWARDEMGASELFSSWEMTRITFFQISASCRGPARR